MNRMNIPWLSWLLIPWWGWLMIALIGLYVVIGIVVGIYIKEWKIGALWPIALLFALLGGGAQ